MSRQQAGDCSLQEPCPAAPWLVSCPQPLVSGRQCRQSPQCPALGPHYLPKLLSYCPSLRSSPTCSHAISWTAEPRASEALPLAFPKCFPPERPGGWPLPSCTSTSYDPIQQANCSSLPPSKEFFAVILSHLAVLLTTDGSASLTMKLRKGTLLSLFCSLPYPLARGKRSVNIHRMSNRLLLRADFELLR